MLKQAKYGNWGFPLVGPKWATVDYARVGNTIIFSGITNPATSTINAAEDIILAICAQEGCQPTAVRCFDLQTHLNYSGTEPGEFMYDEVKFKVRGGKLEDLSWDGSVPCPPEVVALFREHIGGTGEPYRMENPLDHRSYHELRQRLEGTEG